jgi:hypothetical protein
MTGRERLAAVLARRPKDRMPWTTLVDDVSLENFPANLRGNYGIDFYRHLGCDIFMLNGWNTPYKFRSPELRWGPSVRQECRSEGRTQIATWHTPRGSLTSVHQQAHLAGVGHPKKYPVDSVETLYIYRAMWEEAHFQRCDDSSPLAILDELIGNDGVVTRFWGPSTVPLLLEEVMGSQNFYYLLADYPEEMDGLIRTMHQRELDAFAALADGPCSSITLVENTSTYYISPQIYRSYNMPHQRDFVEIVKARGKTAILHMCGHIHDILPLVKETGCDGIHTLTPPPTGNMPWERALDVLGEDLIIFGCLDPSIFAGGEIRDIPAALDRLITPRLREANFVLNPMADGIPVELARFHAVKEWMENNT